MLPALGRARADLPAELTAAIDRALLPDPEARGGLDDLFDALADALPEVDDEGGSIAPHPLERRLPLLPPAIGRLVAPAAAGALVWAALAGLTPEPALAPPLAAAATVAAVALLPRLGWLAAASATALALAFGPAPRPGAALLVLALALGSPLLLRADGRAWALPAAAPVLGLAGLAGAYPALAGRAPRWGARLALGMLGAWWVVLAEPLLDRSLVFGPVPGTPEPRGIRRGAGDRGRRRPRARRHARARSPSACCGASPRSSCRGSCAGARSSSTRSPPPSGRPGRRRPRRRWRWRSACPSRAASWPVR